MGELPAHGDVQVSWEAVMFGGNSDKHFLAGNSAEAAMLCSLAWVPDGSSVAVMDKWGNLALLDVHGTAHCLLPVATLAHKQKQVSAARSLFCEIPLSFCHAIVAVCSLGCGVCTVGWKTTLAGNTTLCRLALSCC